MIIFNATCFAQFKNIAIFLLSQKMSKDRIEFAKSVSAKTDNFINIHHYKIRWVAMHFISLRLCPAL